MNTRDIKRQNTLTDLYLQGVKGFIESDGEIIAVSGIYAFDTDKEVTVTTFTDNETYKVLYDSIITNREYLDRRLKRTR